MWMPFRRAVQLLGCLTGIQISEAPARRQTSQIGGAVLQVQNIAAHRLPGERKTHGQLVIIPDGALVPLVGGPWADVTTVVVGEVTWMGPQEEIHRTQVSSFSRMEPAPILTEQASGIWLHREADHATQVCVVMDGAEWMDGFVDDQRQDALHMLDVAYAAASVSAIGQLAPSAGSALPSDWLPKQRHERKHQGPSAVLPEGES